MQHWLLVRGGGERRLDPAVRVDEISGHRSTRRPAIRAGDRALLYAAGWQVLFAAADVVGDPEEDGARVRWRWRFALRPELVLDDLRDAPPVQAAGVLTSSLGRHSYVRLTPEQFAAGRRAVAAAIVAAGYDRMADRFAAWQREVRGSTRERRVERLLAELPAEPEVLELGVGAGVRSSRLLAGRARLTGVDVSHEQLARARSRLPGARLLQADVLDVDFPPGSFDAVVALYALNHVPRDELRGLLERVASWLRPGGRFLAMFGASDTPVGQSEWLGVPMLFSGLEPRLNEALVGAAGLESLHSDVEEIAEPEGRARFHWVLARKPE